MADFAFLKHGDAELRIGNDGRYSLRFPGFELRDCASGLRLNRTESCPLAWQVRHADGSSVELFCENTLGAWHMYFEATENRSGVKGIAIRIAATLLHPCRELSIVPLAAHEVTLDHVLLQGISMGGAHSVKFPAREKSAMEGSYIAMLSRGGRHLQLSTPLRQKIVATFAMQCETNGLESLRISFDTLHWDATQIETDPVSIFGGADPFGMMTDWAEENTEVRKDFTEMIQPGWNSWDYYRWTITEEEVLKNAEFIAHDPVLSKHVKRIIVDDGWQYCYGEWEANPLFPNGMEYLARELTKMGFQPGLWVAPTIVEPHCRIGQLERDMLALSEGGQPCLCYSCMERFGFVLDPTVPKVQKHLYNLFDRYASMGYKYFKLDFMGQTLSAQQYHDKSVSRSEIARLIVKPIEEAVRGRAAILGCNYHFNAGNRYVDAVRVGGDIHSTWNGICHNVISVAARFFSNKRWWINDPDFALCRAFDTANDPDLTKLRACWVYVRPETAFQEAFDFKLVDINKPQSEILLSIVLMAAGAVNLSDNLPRLNADGVELARRVVSAPSGETGIPLDLFESDRPAYWMQKVGTQHRVLLINWHDEPQTMEFDLAKHQIAATQAVNFWNDEPVAITDNRIRVELAPRSCLLAVLN